MANVTQPVVKISGYLEKKAKLRIGSPWKKYWFVLEGRLLLYYRSKDEYETLSPCKGSINLCPPCNIKPALSSACVFQIECRASTVTLRAENRPEQERWMQALLAAIAQSKSSPNRMSHFRYSLDDLPISTADAKKTENALSRQNTMPYRILSSPKKDPKDLIERLQQIGAQTYGGSLGTITKLANKAESAATSPALSERYEKSLKITPDVTATSGEDSQKSRSSTPTDKQQSLKLTQKSYSNEKIQSMFIENDQYSTIQEENSLDLSLEGQVIKTVKTEKTKSIIIDNDEYMGEDIIKLLEINESSNQSNKESVARRSFILENDEYCYSKEEEETHFIRNKEVHKIEHLYERISADSNISEYITEHKNRKESVRKIKQITTNLYERMSSDSSNSDTQIKMNDQYSVVHKDDRQMNKGSRKLENLKAQENEYSEPINSKTEDIDYNKNSLIIDNDQYLPTADDKTNDNLYSDGLIYKPEYSEYAAIDKIKEQEELYEDPDRLKKRQSSLYQDVEPILPPRPDLKKTESSEETSSQTSNDGKKHKKSRFKMLTHLVRSEKKSVSHCEATKPKTKSRSTSFIRKVWRRKAKSLDYDDEIMYETIDSELVEKQMGKDKNDIEMLQELQKILEARKNLLQEKLHSNENKADNTKPQAGDSKVQPIVEEKEEESFEIRTEGEVKEQRPSLPPRQNSQTLSPYHDVPENNKAVEPQTVNNSPTNDSASNSNDKISNSNQIETNIKTIDEILQDLDKEKNIQESRQKVKQLIEKFNDFQNEDEEVVLRKKTKLELCKSQSDTTVLRTLDRDSLNDKVNRESDELTKLLEELSKVTCAPVLTPGVTSSLVTPVLSDDEWLLLIPIRRRRLSDPDYDVPRPHRSLQLQGRIKQVPDNAIPATRFFGPILPPSSTTDQNMITTDPPSLTSMDPDSLELEQLSPTEVKNETDSVPQKAFRCSNTIEKDQLSYTSHDYMKDEKVVYAHPKAIILSTKFNANRDNNIYSNINITNLQKTNLKVKENNDRVVNVRTIEINEDLLPIVTKSDETFIDSLEPLAEMSTAF